MVHIFDVDLTVIRKTSAQYFVGIALKEKIIRFSHIMNLPIEYIKYKLALPDMDFIEQTVKKLAGLKKNDLERIAEICFETKIKQSIYPDAEKLINDAVKKGEKVIFATSSFDFIVKPLEKYFGIETSLASKMEYRDGITTGNLEGFSLFGEKKKIAVQAWMEKNSIRREDTSFYSDSYTDIPLLEYCGNPFAVNPDRILMRRAKKHGWKILKFV